MKAEKTKLEKTVTIMIPVLVILSILSIIGMAFILAVKNEKNNQIYFPPATLSDSLFYSQEFSYLENEFLPARCILEEKYVVDMYETEEVVLDESHHFLAVSESGNPVTSYFVKCTDQEGMDEEICSELLQLYGDGEAVSSENYILEAKSGYANGFAVDYMAYQLVFFADEQKSTVTGSVCGMIYSVSVTDNERIIVGCATRDKSQENLTLLLEDLDAMLLTVRVYVPQEEAAEKTDTDSDTVDEPEENNEQNTSVPIDQQQNQYLTQ